MALAGMLAGGLLDRRRRRPAPLARRQRHHLQPAARPTSPSASSTTWSKGPLRDPASLNKPSTYPIPESAMIGNMFGLDVHWGLAFGVVFCLVA